MSNLAMISVFFAVGWGYTIGWALQLWAEVDFSHQCQRLSLVPRCDQYEGLLTSVRIL